MNARQQLALCFKIVMQEVRFYRHGVKIIFNFGRQLCWVLQIIVKSYHNDLQTKNKAMWGYPY